MFFKTRWIVLPLCVFLIWLSVSTCEKRESERSPSQDQTHKKWDRKRAELEYCLIQAELALAKSEELYLVLNLERKELQLKLKGVVVWNHPMNVVEPDSQELQEFVERFQGDEGRVMRPLSGKHLFSAKEKTPDSVLSIVSEAVKADPDLLRRDLPARFQLLWGYSLTLEIRTDIVGEPRSRIKSTLVEFRHALRRPFGEARLIVRMHPEDALTLYRAAQPDLPTLLYSPL
ncbi:MAG: hypothetical protein AMJ73_08475 [candidate division Zixibacteria bacterium SM1_73]|nr:MAG: hypothetical protein AMJ73_08475 [candidate division Zixibacteria bacterium SM1_73]